MKRYFLPFIAIFLIVLSAIFYEVSTASAASPYDNVVTVAPNLVLNNMGSGDPTLDVSLNWYENALQSSLALCNWGNVDSCTVNQNLKDLLTNPNANWAVTTYKDRSSYTIAYSFDPNAHLEFVGDKLVLVASDSRHTNSFSFYPSHPFPKAPSGITYGGGIETSQAIIAADSAAYSFMQVFLSTFPITYPPGYEGQTVPDSFQPPEKVELTPEYQYSVNSNGLLSVTYLKNITPFLSGTNFFVLNKTSDNWETLGPQIFSESFTPAGWTDKTFEQLLDPGHYVLRISHSQTFDSSSPWTKKDVWVHDVYIQFFWDGETTFTGTTTGCEGQVCNIFQTDESEKMWNMFEKLGLGHDEFGLGAAVTAPLTFIASLPSKASNCTPISLTLPYVNRQIILPCMTSIYQTHFGLIFSLFQTIMLGLFGYYAAVKVYGNIKQMKDPEDDRIEVVKL